MTEQELLPRITRDISDGIVVLDLHGTIQFVNPAARQLLNEPKLLVGEKYASAMMTDDTPENDAFHQFLLDAVYDKQTSHSGELDYVRRDGTRYRLRLTSSYLFNDDHSEQVGAVIQFSDVTEVAVLRKKNTDSARVFVLLMGSICLWVFLFALWNRMGQPVSSSVMTFIIELLGIVLFLFLWRFTSITFDDMGLRIQGAKRYLLIDAVFSAAALLVLIAIKAVLLKLRPDAFQKHMLFNWSAITWSGYIYPITVILQEFLTRGVVHESVKRILPGKHADAVAIIISSFYFGALHIHKGLLYMVGAVLLLSLFGVIYRRQKCIWGLCIPHYVLGLAVSLLFEVA